MHEQVWTKVNARVDAGVVRIVEALSAFPTLQTFESCEGTMDGVWVCFSYGDSWESSWREAAEFIFDFFAPRLFEKVGDAASIVLRPCANGRLLIDMTVRRGSAESVEAAIGDLAQEFRSYQRATPDAFR
jgi:hypothetical protein